MGIRKFLRVLIGDRRALMPPLGPFDMIVAAPPYGEIRNDTSDLGSPATLTGLSPDAFASRAAQLCGDLDHIRML
jgi:hypothetical protein